MTREEEYGFIAKRLETEYIGKYSFLSKLLITITCTIPENTSMKMFENRFKKLIWKKNGPSSLRGSFLFFFPAKINSRPVERNNIPKG